MLSRYRATINIAYSPPILAGEIVEIDPEDPELAPYLSSGDGHGPYLIPENGELVVVEGAGGTDDEVGGDDEFVALTGVGDSSVNALEPISDAVAEDSAAAVELPGFGRPGLELEDRG